MDATANLDRNDTKLFHLMCPTPIGGLPLGTLITTRADEATICEALDLYKSLLTEKSFFGRGSGHSIPAGMECIHSIPAGMAVSFQQEWSGHSIPTGIEWPFHSCRNGVSLYS